MKIFFSKNFDKQYKKLRPNEKKRVNKTILIFKNNPHEHKLKNHALKGKLSKMRAISVGGDLRIIFEIKDNYVQVLFLNIGKHNFVY